MDALTKRLDDMQVTLSANETQIAEIQVERDTAITERDNVIKERDDAVAEKQKVETQQAVLIEEQQQQADGRPPESVCELVRDAVRQWRALAGSSP